MLLGYCIGQEFHLTIGLVQLEKESPSPPA
jgi:hypothetical protein